jgi:hypothetical protein
MFVIVLGLVLTAMLVMKLGSRRLLTADLGAMSNTWVNAHNASQPASSM